MQVAIRRIVILSVFLMTIINSLLTTKILIRVKTKLFFHNGRWSYHSPNFSHRADKRETVAHVRKFMLFGTYLPPEQDPEYRDRSISSNLKTNESFIDIEPSDFVSILPLPCENDIVKYPSKWPGNSDIGRLRNVFRSKEQGPWLCEILPMKEGKSNNILTVDNKAKMEIHPLSSVQPVRSYFVRSENGYRVSFKVNSTEVILKAPSYNSLDGGFEFRRVVVNSTALASDFQSYSALKTRIIKSTILFGLFSSAVSWTLFGSEVSIPLLCGSFCGALYFFLLGLKTDSVGLQFSMSKSPTSSSSEGISNLRLSLPALTVIIIAIKNYFDGGSALSTFRMLSKEQFLGAMFGFMSYFFAILYSEVLKEMRISDAVGILPGSFVEALKISQNLESNSKSLAISNKAEGKEPLIFVTGPRAAGRNAVIENLVQKSLSRQNGGNLLLQYVKLLATDKTVVMSNPMRYTLVSEEKLRELRDRGDVIHESLENGFFGQSWKVALSYSELRAPAMAGKCAVLDASPSFFEKLSGLPGYKVINIWVSLQTKENFMKKSIELVQKELSSTLLLPETNATVSERSAEEVVILVNEAARDINYYMQKAPLFEFTILNDGTVDEKVQELELVLGASLR